MVIGAEGTPFFTFIDPSHPFYSPIRQWEGALWKSPLYQKMKERMERPDSLTIQSEIKSQPLPDGGWEMNRFYASFQYWDRSAPFRFDALTLYYSAKRGELKIYPFPEDPYLVDMASYLSEDVNGRRMDILRYVPLRRLTFRISSLEGDGIPVIGKFKRRSRFREGADKLLRVYREVERSSLPFSVAAPLGIDEEHALFFQEAKGGKDLSSLLTFENFKEPLDSVGAIHYALHSLDVPGIPIWDAAAFREGLKRDLQWISFFRPEQGSFVNDLSELLLREAPRIDPAGYAFCHGDFVCSQLLKEGDQWAVTDFDLAMRGDPYLEIAMFIASLKYDVPLFEREVIASKGEGVTALEEGIESYLNGYQQKAKSALNWKRFLWYRICAEIYYLALMFKKDRFHPIIFDDAIGLLRGLTRQFQKEGGREF